MGLRSAQDECGLGETRNSVQVKECTGRKVQLYTGSDSWGVLVPVIVREGSEGRLMRIIIRCSSKGRQDF